MIYPIYAPVVNSSIPAFTPEDNLIIPFKIPSLIKYDDVKHLAIKIVKQTNNKTIVDTEKYIDGIIYIREKPLIANEKGEYELIIPKNYIKINGVQGWSEGIDEYLKIQIRFGYSELDFLDGERINYLLWKKNNGLKNSEWSNIIITKIIHKPIINILNNKMSEDLTNNFFNIILKESVNIESNSFPEFLIEYSNTSQEPVDKYYFILYQDNELYLDSGWLQYNQKDNIINKQEINNEILTTCFIQHRFPQTLMENKKYSLHFNMITKNLYTLKQDVVYNFEIKKFYLEQYLENLSLVVKDNSNNNYYKNLLLTNNPDDAFRIAVLYSELSNYELPKEIISCELLENGDIILNQDLNTVITKQNRIKLAEDFVQNIYCDENAVLQIYIKNNPYIEDSFSGKKIQYQNLSGIYYLIRASEKTNYSIWEDLAKFTFYDEDFYNDDLKLLYEDFTVESGINYKYALQKANIYDFRTEPVYEKGSSLVHHSNFEYCYLYQNGIQLKIDLDAKIQNLKKTKSFQKQDSLNSKYPIILRNGAMNYTEFQLTGKISFHSDEEDNTFLFKRNNKGYYWENELIIDTDKYLESYIKNNEERISNSFNLNHTKDNIFIERKYRESVEKFLNDGNYKLFKSPTEGNILVTLTDISFTPNQQLGRLISDFSATLYEIGENNIYNLIQYNVNPLTVVSNRMKQNGTLNKKVLVTPGQLSGVFDGKFKKTIIITEDIYQSAINEKFMPEKYFIKDVSKNEYWSQLNLPGQLLDYILSFADTKVLDQNNFNWDRQEDNIIQLLKDNEELEISKDYKYRINNLNSFSIEVYPKLNLEQELINLINKQTYNQIEELEKKLLIAKYQLILKEYQFNQDSPIILIMDIEGENQQKEITIFPNKIYSFSNINLNALYLKYSRPLLINYQVEKEIIDNTRSITSGYRKISNIGQIHGVFSNNEKITNNYIAEHNYQFNYNVYPTLNILDIIKNKVHNHIINIFKDTISPTVTNLEIEIENILRDINNFNISYEEQVQEIRRILREYKPYTKILNTQYTDLWKNELDQIIIYNFSDLKEIEIESEENCELLINGLELNNSTNLLGGSRVIIGPTNKYKLNLENLNNKDFQIESIVFTKPSFGIINFKADIVLEIQNDS